MIDRLNRNDFILDKNRLLVLKFMQTPLSSPVMPAHFCEGRTNFHLLTAPIPIVFPFSLHAWNHDTVSACMMGWFTLQVSIQRK